MTASPQMCLIDIGGTAIKYGLSSADGVFAFKGQMPTEAHKSGGPGIVQKVKDIVTLCKERASSLQGVAISTAGMVDPDSGLIVYALPDAIPDYTGINLAEVVKETFNLPCTVENDVNCAALGEMWLGGGRGCRSVFCMTIGTSIGGAMICDQKLISGVSHSAGEIAYMRVPGGMLHEVASTTFLVHLYAQKSGLPVEQVNGVLIFDRAEQGEALACECIDTLVEHLSDAICNVVSVQNPEAVILGGGIMARSGFLRPRLERALQGKLRPVVLERTKIAFATLQNDAGMLGALFNFRQRTSLQGQ